MRKLVRSLPPRIFAGGASFGGTVAGNKGEWDKLAAEVPGGVGLVDTPDPREKHVFLSARDR